MKTQIEELNESGSKLFACIDMSGYDKINPNDINKKAQWLVKYGKSVCPTILNSRAIAEHIIRPTVSVEPIDINLSLIKTWREIKKTIGTNTFYDVYIGFEIDANSDEILDLKTINLFTTSEVCYSITLFTSIVDFQKLNDDSKFSFEYANVNGERKIIIRVDTLIYDYSQNPPLTVRFIISTI